MKISRNDHRIDITLEDLIAAISNVAFEYSDDANEAYHLAGVALVEILKSASLRSGIVGQYPLTSKYLH